MKNFLFVFFSGVEFLIAQPKLVVGIVVDQMKYEYLERFEPLYSKNGGFARLLSEGFFYKNAHYNYAPTYTGPGHASIYTGSTPMYHGIVGNDWYDRSRGKSVYCAEDETVKTVGDDSREGLMSCRPLLASTITDELKLQSPNSKVIGISVKDRGSIFPAGHAADAAYWLADESGRFITSTYYMNSLPKWVSDFNRQNLVDKYLSQNWTTALPLSAYLPYTDADDSPHEGTFTGMAKAVFPYPLPALRQKGGRKLIKGTPYGNSIVLDFAKEAVKQEKLGLRSVTDFLAISFSSPDYIGHMFGPRSVEVADNYVRLDRELGEFFDFLDKTVGKGNYLVFLTADHAVADIPSFLTERRVPAGGFDYALVNDLKKYLFDTFGDSLIESATNLNIYLNHGTLKAKKLDYLKVMESAKYFLLTKNPIIHVFTAQEITQSHAMGFNYLSETARSYFYRRSGDLVMVLEPAHIEGSSGRRGTTHGSMYAYDTRVPIVFYGAGIKAGSASRRVHITDIAPTLALLLKTSFPNACMGNPLVEITDAQSK
ncbi:alkaline phosphatase PafA [Thermaurantimonas aggregans]|uniref:alkaline phosphatase PafA n=1 Tax=Thermaurantimonas aggregans TaxID=2173829 RepID=UPI0023F183D2|nr:alkaline phosphatase PafA [Thermaurantimonas aggregans]MCX8148014.1 alkaline phosphatase family protein [Thermaurantimonas aggregans]